MIKLQQFIKKKIKGSIKVFENLCKIAIGLKNVKGICIQLTSYNTYVECRQHLTYIINIIRSTSAVTTHYTVKPREQDPRWQDVGMHLNLTLSK